MNKLIAEVALTEDLNQNSEGLDKQVLREAVQVTEEQFSKPMDSVEFLLSLGSAGLL